MSEPHNSPGGPPEEQKRRLLLVRAAQLRARVRRWALGKSVLGVVFLIGALAYAAGPDRHLPSSRIWMTLLVVLSTFNVGLGLRTLSRLRPRAARFWPWVTGLWGLLATALVRLLATH